MKYYVALKEADHVCGQLVNTTYKDGCLSDDMDMFVYGSKYVYRNLDIVNGTCLQYDLDLILKYLNIDFEDFKWMCILSNNDYNTSSKNVFEYYKMHKQYKFSKTNKQSNFIDYIKSIENMNEEQINTLTKIYSMYTSENESFDENNIVCNENNKAQLYEILEKDNFIYPPQIKAC